MLDSASNARFYNVQFWHLIKSLAPAHLAPALFGGGLLGYVMYDVTHYYLHHGQPTSDMPRKLKVISIPQTATVFTLHLQVK